MNNPSFSPASNNTQRPRSSTFSAIKKLTPCLLLTGLLNGCWAPDIKAPMAVSDKLKSILVVAVESPPLEIYPDPIKQRIPAYNHYDNMAMPVDLDTLVYRNAGGIVIAGQISQDEEVNLVVAERSMAPSTESDGTWTPSHAIAQLAQNRLSTAVIRTVLSRDYQPLPIANAERNANLGHWHHAIQNWYALDKSTSDYSKLGAYNAVLEVGIANYRIFESQTSLQVLLKLIDPASGRVIARSRADSFEVDNTALNSLNTDSQAFKNRVTQLGKLLLKQALDDIGLPATTRVAFATQ